MIIDPIKRGHSPTRNENPVGDLEGRDVSQTFSTKVPSHIRPARQCLQCNARSLQGRCVLRFPKPSRSKGS